MDGEIHATRNLADKIGKRGNVVRRRGACMTGIIEGNWRIPWKHRGL
jgi:hypothetical protein